MPKRLICLLVLLTFFPSVAMGLPVGGKAVGGTVNIGQAKNQSLHINQLTDRAIINWKGFNINVNELVKFIQPSSKSVILNRVTGVDPSSILGKLVANGRVFVVNPNGILFGPNAAVDVSGLLATTLNIKDADFMAGKFNFFQDPGKNPSYVINQGQIRVSDNGFVFLAAPGVSNEGLIIANLGKIVMGSGEKFTVDFLGDGLITFAIDGKILNHVTGPGGAPLSSAVANTGKITADGGQIILSAKASSEIFASVINNSGIIEARSLVNRGGIIRLEGSDPVPNTGAIGWQANLSKVKNADGRVLNTGTLDVSAREAGAIPGEVTLSGQMVGMSGSILAQGADGAQGGRVLAASSEKTILTQDSVIDTSGVGNSSAGNTVVWSDNDTVFRGTIVARGGETGGNGGQIEVSGHENLVFTGQVNALAPNGNVGSLLLDPRNITVATTGTATLPQVDQFSDTPSTNLTIAPTTINAAGANVFLQANNDITVNNAIAMTSPGVGITMQAGRDITVNAGIGTNNGNISLTANDSTAIGANRANATAGDIAFGAGANLSAGTGNITLTIDPSTTNPFNPGSITTVRNLTTSSGNISINSPNNVTLSGAVNAGPGTVTINANSDGAGAQGFTMNSGSSITTTGGVNVNVNAAGGGTGTAALRDIATSGTLSVQTNTGGNTTGGAISQTAGTTITAGTANLATGNGAITLNTATNDFGTVAVSRATNVTLQDANSLNLGASTISGTLNVTTSGAITDSGNLNVTGTTTLAAGVGNDITLNSAGNNFSTVAITSGRNVTLVDSNALNLGTSTVSGALSVTIGGAITDSGNVVVTGTTTLAAGAGNDITVDSVGNNFSTVAITSGNNVTLRDANALDLAVSTISGNLNVTTAGAITDSGNLTVSGTTTLAAGAANDITLDSAGNNFSTVAITSGRNVTVVDSDALNLGTSTVSGTLNATTTGAITDSGNLVITGATTLAAGAGNDITLDNANNFSTVAITSGRNVTLNDTNALALGPSTVSGTLGVTTAGAITQSGPLNVTGATTLAAGAGNDITLNNALNNFSTVGITSGRNVTLVDSNALDLGASSVSGNLSLTTGGAVTQSGALSIAGTTSFTANAADTDILLNTQANNLVGALSFGGTLANFRDIGLRNTNAGATDPTLSGLTNLRNLTLTFDSAPVNLPTLTASGTLNVTAGGAITGSGNVVVAGGTTLTAGAANDITLDSAGNNFSTVTVNSGNNVTLQDANALNLGTSNVTGNLNVTTAGAITDSGHLVVAGITTLAAGAGNDITLDSVGNNFSTVGVTSGRNVVLADANDLDLGTSTVSGSLNVTTNGALTQSGALNVTGATTVSAGPANHITLNNGSNDFSTVTVNSANNVTFADANALNLGASTVSGTLNVTPSGSLTQSGALTVAGTTTLAAGSGNDITLTNAGNNFSTVAVVSARNVALTDANTLDLGTSTISGNLNVTTSGAITDSGNVLVTGTTTLAAGAANDITLDSAGNNFSTVTVNNGNNVVLTDATAVDLGASTISGTLNVVANGLISQSGALTIAGTASFDTTAATALGSVNLTNGGALRMGTSTIGGSLALTTATGDLTLEAGHALTVASDANLTAGGSVNLLGAAQIAGTQALNGGTGSTFVLASDTNLNALPLPSSGNVTINLTGTQATFAGAPILPSAVNLSNAGNNFGGTVSVTTASPAFTGNVTNTHDLAQTSPVSLNPGQALTVTDAGGTAGKRGNITLDNSGNSFNTVNFTGGDIAWRQINPISIGSVSANPGTTSSGALTMTANGPITQTGPVTAGVTTLNATGANITLAHVTNDFNTVSVTSGNDVILVDANTVNLAASLVTGNLNVTTNGPLTQSGPLIVAGTTTLAAGFGENITLNSASNDFSTVVVTSGNNVALVDTNGLDLGASAISGNFDVNTGSAVTQSGALNVAGNATFAAGASNDITLNHTANDFSTLAITSGRNVTVQDANALNLGASTVSGALNVTTGGALTQSGPVVVAGVMTLAAGVGDITLDNAGNDLSTVEITSANHAALRDSNNISLGTSTVAGNFSVTAGEAILDGDGTAINITGTTANLFAASNIGTAVDPLEINVGTLNASTTGGGIFVNQANAVTLANISAGGGNDIAISNTSGNMTVNSVTTTGGALTLASQSGAIQDGNGAANNVTAGTLLASAANGIDLDTTINNLSSAIVTGAGFIDINNAGALTVNNMTAANGDIALNATGGSLVINAVTGAGDVTLSTTTSGDITLGTVTSPNSVTITSAGGISGTNGAATHISANTANLAAAASVGTSGDPIGTSVGMLNVAATAGGIYINETDTVTLGNIVARSGHVSIHNTTGNMIINSITAAAGGIVLQASAGSIFDGNGTANNLTAVADSNLRALGGVIGLSTDPIEVNISSGMLGVAATGQAGGVSIDINGAVLPSGTLTLLNSPPGEVIFNSQILHPASISPPNLTAPDLTGIAAELNPQRVNEDDYVTELLLDVLGDDLVEAQPLYCKSDDSLRASLHSHPCTETNR